MRAYATSPRAHPLGNIVAHPVPFQLLSALVVYMNRLHISPEARTWSATFGDEEDTDQHTGATRLT